MILHAYCGGVVSEAPAMILCAYCGGVVSESQQ